MSAQTPESQQEQKPTDKELNFRALEQKYQRELDKERKAREEAEKAAKDALERTKQAPDDDDGDSEPYVDHKRLNRKLNNLGQATQSEIQKAMEKAKISAKEELKQELWLENNPDFFDVLQHAEKFAQRAPKLAETILKMPEGFERQKLVYENIKQLELHKPAPKQSSIQDKVDANRRSPYYQPTGVNSPPFASTSDFSETGQKNAYQKMQELKRSLRL